MQYSPFYIIKWQVLGFIRHFTILFFSKNTYVKKSDIIYVRSLNLIPAKGRKRMYHNGVFGHFFHH